jgi:hypothetical protein
MLKTSSSSIVVARDPFIVRNRMPKEVSDAMPPMSRTDDSGFLHRYGEQRRPALFTGVAMCELW